MNVSFHWEAPRRRIAQRQPRLSQAPRLVPRCVGVISKTTEFSQECRVSFPPKRDIVADAAFYHCGHWLSQPSNAHAHYCLLLLQLPTETRAGRGGDLVIVRQRGDCELAIHPQCFLSDGHFAGPDEARLAALREVMADPSVDACGSRAAAMARTASPRRLSRTRPRARTKTTLAIATPASCSPECIRRGSRWRGADAAGRAARRGEAAVGRALDWLVRRDPSALEPGLQGPAMAFNLTVLSNLLGTSLEPDFSGVDLLIEDVSEHLYRIDRSMFHVTAAPNVRRAARIRLGRVSDILPTTPISPSTRPRSSRIGARRSGIPFGGRADIGHDATNKVVPFRRKIADFPSEQHCNAPRLCALSTEEQQEGHDGTRRT